MAERNPSDYVLKVACHVLVEDGRKDTYNVHKERMEHKVNKVHIDYDVKRLWNWDVKRLEVKLVLRL